MSNELDGQVQQQGQVKDKGLSEMAKQNLERNKEMWREESIYIKLEDGESRALLFNPEKIKHIEGQFGKRVQYLVIDPNFSEKGDKKFECGKTVSHDIDQQLNLGNTLPKLTRMGEGTDTKYKVESA